MTEKKDTEKETKQSVSTKSQSTKNDKKREYKRKKQLSYDDVNQIIDWMERERIKPDDVSKEYGCSVSISRKLFSILRKKELKPLPDNPKPPKCYYFPKSIDDVVNSVLFDKGYYI